MARFRRFDVVVPGPAIDNTIDAVRERRAGMGSAIRDLERAIAAPSDGGLELWAKNVCVALDALRDLVDHHIFATEAPGGFLDDIVETAPRLANTAHRLREEHGEIVDALSATSARLRARPTVDSDEWVDAIRARVCALVALLGRHRQRGADLVYEAYAVDIGGDNG